MVTEVPVYQPVHQPVTNAIQLDAGARLGDTTACIRDQAEIVVCRYRYAGGAGESRTGRVGPIDFELQKIQVHRA